MANRLMRLSKIEREKRLADYYKYVSLETLWKDLFQVT